MTSSINLLGLTVGLTCCLLILIYIINELSYDRFNAKAGQIYRVTRSFNTIDGVENLHLATVAPPFGPLLKNDFPDIEKVTRILSNGLTVFRYKDKILNERNAYYAETNFFDFFSVPLLKGNIHNALEEPLSVLLNEETAKKYFGNEDPINKMVKLDNLYTYKVTGIFSDFPASSHFHPKILISFSSLKDSTLYGERQLQSNWSNNAFHTYLMLPQNYPVKNIESKFPSFLNKNMPSRNMIFKPSQGTKLHLQKLTDIHLQSALEAEIEPNGSISRVYIFSCIALFILLIACINYMNLSTARSVLRAKEIGIRKAIGAKRKEIIAQFLSESVLITFISLSAAILITLIILPYINLFSGQQLSATVLLNYRIVALMLVLPFIIGFISGAYPALFLSSFEPVKVLKGVLKVSKSNFSFRKVLVVTQFSVSIILIISTIIVLRQLSFMQNTNLGFNKDCVVTSFFSSDLTKHYASFKNELLKTSLVKSITRSSRIPTGNLLDDLGGLAVMNGDSMKPVQNVDMKLVSIDYDYIPTFGIEMAAGRNFTNDFSTDSNNFVINAAAAKALGWKDPAIAVGKDVRYGGVQGKIVGITKDFHFESMHKDIVPIIFSPSRQNSLFTLSFKIDGNNMHKAISEIEKRWHAYLPDVPFQYTFIDDNVKQLYKSEQQQSTLFTIFSVIAIFIACLGLLGLSSFTITQRIKEIGIRKILGASIPELVKLLSTDFIYLVFAASVISFPVAWFMMDKWLRDFAYRISIPLWAFILSGSIAILIAFITISSQTVKAAIANPVKSLRTE